MKRRTTRPIIFSRLLLLLVTTLLGALTFLSGSLSGTAIVIMLGIVASQLVRLVDYFDRAFNQVEPTGVPVEPTAATDMDAQAALRPTR